jgi:hypothetical protein
MRSVEATRAAKNEKYREKEGRPMKAWDIRMIRVACLMAALAMPVASLPGCFEPQSDSSDSSQLGPSQLAAEVRGALAEPNYMDRNGRLVSALRQLAPSNVDAVAAVYTELLRDLGESELEPLLDAWANFDAPAAFEYSMDVPYVGVRESAQRAAIYSWAVRNALEARVAAGQAAAVNRRNSMLFYQALVGGWVMSGQDGLDDYILAGSGLEDPGQLILAAQPMIYLRDGPDGLLEWSENMVQRATDYTARMKAFRYAVRTAGFRNPQAAIPFVLRHYGEEYAEEGPRVLADTWAHRDPEAALNWIRNGAPEAARPNALGMTVSSWLIRDREAARDWLESAPVGEPYYQPAFDSLAKRLAKRDPEEAIEWCQRGRTPEVNSLCLQQVAGIWFLKDAVAAERWLEEESGLSVENMASVRQRASRAAAAAKSRKAKRR